MSALLTMTNVDTYYGFIQALRGASMEIAKGSTVAILGANGAGKTTLLKTVMGMIEDQPDKGTITLEGKSLVGMDTEDVVRQGVIYVPEGRQVFEELTVTENLLAGAYTRKDDIKPDLERVYGYFPRLAERKDQWAGTLSGGEQQMLAISRALMGKPNLLLLDEPSLGLSPLLVKEIFDIIRLINLSGVTILLVEQNAKMALGVAHRALVMENGRFVLEGTSEEISNDPDVREFYLGMTTQESIKGYKRYRRKKRWR